MAEHKWTGCRQGGSPGEAGSYEWVRYCAVCGMEDTVEDAEIPPCQGTEADAIEFEKFYEDVFNITEQTQ